MSSAALRLADLPTLSSIETTDFHRQFVNPGLPVRIRGAIGDWPALGRWSPADFVTRFGDIEITTYALQDGRFVLDDERGFRLERLSIRDYVSHVLETKKPRVYFRGDLSKVLPELRSEFAVPEYCKHRPALRYNLWFSGAGTITPLHFDLPHNLVAQVYGRKRFILFSQDESRNLYRHSWLSSTPHLARVDLEAPDYARYPRLQEARGFVCQMEPGDLLFIPSRFWHHANSTTASISVNFWWATPGLLPLIKASDTYKRLRGLNI